MDLKENIKITVLMSVLQEHNVVSTNKRSQADVFKFILTIVSVMQ